MASNRFANKHGLPCIKFLQINMRKSKAVTSNIVEITLENSFDILLIQEPYNYNNIISGFPKSFKIFSAGEGKKRAAVVVANKGLDVIMLSDKSDEDMVLVEVCHNNGSKLWLVSAYFDITSDINDDLAKLDNVLLHVRSRPLLAALDSNARSTLWYDRRSNSRGQLLESFIISNSLIILNEDDDSPTFCTRSSRSNIDLTLANMSIVSSCVEWQNGFEESASDHHLISFKLKFTTNTSNNQENSFIRYNINKADWEKFENKIVHWFKQLFNIENFGTPTVNELDEILATRIISKNDLEKLASDYMNAIKLAADAAIPKKIKLHKNMQRKTVCWWSHELTEMRRKVNSLRRKYQRTYFNQELRKSRKQEYFELKYNYVALINKSKNSSWRDYCNNTGKSEAWNSVYKSAAGKLNSTTALTTLQKSDGTFTTTLEETLNVLMDKFVLVDDEKKDSAINRSMRAEARSPINTCEDLLFTETEVGNALSSFDPSKCPGEDGISPIILLHVFQIFPKLMTAVYNECLRRGIFPIIWKQSFIVPIIKPAKINLNTVEKFRPISLLPVGGKLLEKLIINRIMHHLTTNKCLSDDQYGFRPQRSTVDAIMEVKSFIADSLRQKKHLLFISMDVKGAFDAAWWPAILLALKEFQCPRNLYNITSSYFKDRWAHLQTTNFRVKRRVSKGCPQGSCSAPGYWLIQYDSLLKLQFPESTKRVAFADDFVILIKGNSIAEIEAIGNCSMRLVEKWSEKSKVEFNSSKTKMMHITWKRTRSDINVFLNSEKLELVDEIKYLGVIFDSHFNWNRHIEYVCSKGLQLINKLSRSAKVYWGIGSDALLTIYKGAFIPFVSYAIPAWFDSATKKCNTLKLTRMHRLILLRIIKGYRTISYEAACVISGIPPILLTLKEKHRLYEIERKLRPEPMFHMEHPIECTEWNHPALQPSIIEGELGSNNTFCIYTDGSKQDSSVGCAFIVYREEAALVQQQFRLHGGCSNNQAEQLAIMKALEWATSLAATDPAAANKITIYTDSRISIDCLKNYRCHWPLIHEIRDRIYKLQTQFKVDISFCWVKAHVGDQGNEAADQLAKQASANLDLVESYNKPSRTSIKSILAAESIINWQTSWGDTIKGRNTKDFFHDIDSRLKSPIEKLDFKLTQVLSGHGKNRAYLHRFKVIDDPCCSCDRQTPQTWRHIILDCPRFEPQRYLLIRGCVQEGISWPIRSLSLLMKKKIFTKFKKFLEKIDFTLL